MLCWCRVYCVVFFLFFFILMNVSVHWQLRFPFVAGLLSVNRPDDLRNGAGRGVDIKYLWFGYGPLFFVLLCVWCRLWFILEKLPHVFLFLSKCSSFVFFIMLLLIWIDCDFLKLWSFLNDDIFFITYLTLWPIRTLGILWRNRLGQG